MSNFLVQGGVSPDGSVTTVKIADDAVTTAKIVDDAVTLAKLADGTDGELITWDTSGVAAAVAVGIAAQVLTSNGAGAAPTFQAATGVPAGSIMAYAGATEPSGWVFADGATGIDSTSDTTFADLFTAIGTTYGGTGAADFDLPDLRGRIPLGLDNLGSVSANRMTASAADSLGGTGGSETHVLTTAELASHSHSGWNAAGGIGNNGYQTQRSGAGNTGSAGSSSAHANDQPWIAISYIIKK